MTPVATDQQLGLAVGNLKRVYRDASYVLQAAASALRPELPGTARADAAAVTAHVRNVQDAVRDTLELLDQTTVGTQPTDERKER